jgi:serine/threonine-protein kinase
MSPRQTIAHYCLTAKIGEGGMGEVWRATDTKLNRPVAIKILPDAFADDPDRMARFAREAQVLASLNHPNIAAIYGVEERALIMELVEGEDLRGPLPVDTVIAYARQIADALEYAHERGIIHRDLKPPNIKITPDGRAKVLDFGLAKAISSDTLAGSPEASPTLTMRATQAGVLLGTAAYMSPEQARGKPVDKRTDIWAFGVVLYELLTGAMLFGGMETASDSLAAVITKDPDWSALPKDTPPHLVALLRRCLQKDPKLRLRDIGEARIALDTTSAAALPVAAPVLSPAARPWWGYAAIAVSLVLATLLWRATRPAERPLQRFEADLGPEARAGQRATLAISPDGTRIAFPVQRSGGPIMLATRGMDQSKPTVLSGTEDATIPFFSPDGLWIGFGANEKLKKVSVQGGAPVPLCDLPNFRGASWGEDGYIVATYTGGGLVRVAAAGGAPQPLGSRETGRRWPQILPKGDSVLTTYSPNLTRWDDANIEVFSLKTGQVKIVQRGGYFGRYVPSGHLVYVHQGTLFAVPFDLGHMETRGVPAPVLNDIAGHIISGGGELDFSRTGILAYLSGKPDDAGVLKLQLMDAAGKLEPLMAETSRTPRFSPDGKRLAIAAGGGIAVYDFERGSLTRLPSQQTGGNTWPVWAPDGKHIVYAALDGALWWVRSDGSAPPETLFDGKNGGAIPGSFSPDGRRLAIHQGGGVTGRDIWILPLDLTDADRPKAGTPELFLATRNPDIEPAFSPDGSWLAYTAYASSESGVQNVYVRPYPEGAKGGSQAQISTDSGRFPIWSRIRKELFYTTPDGHIMVVPYTVNGRAFVPGKPRRWSESAITMVGNDQPLDLAPDGKRFAMYPRADTNPDGKANLHITFLLNFFDELKRRVPIQ